MTERPVSRRAVLCGLSLGGLAAGLFLNTDGAHAADKAEQVPLKKVPAKVLEAAGEAVPKAKWKGADKAKDDDDDTVYEVHGKDAKGRFVTVTVTEDGEVKEVETEIPLKDVPKKVLNALKAKHPKFEAEAAFELRENGEVTGYDMEGKRPKGKKVITISVSADGKHVEIVGD